MCLIACVGSAACRSIIARLRMSAAVPWIGMFTASRSDCARIWKLRLVRFGTSLVARTLS